MCMLLVTVILSFQANRFPNLVISQTPLIEI
ncbi:hypothetical protein GLYMA_10G217950v4 [Glycine max]|nr:hypothetical protein GLYMA_10G217950v4 [Glycine max]KAH1139479.1 hypothetical protein GYH30_028740 [Glycine max]